MFPVVRNFLMFAAAGSIFFLAAAVHSPCAETLVAWSF
jgi:hypothetical protein